MNLEFTLEAWEDFEYWVDNDKEVEHKIRSVLSFNTGSIMTTNGEFLQWNSSDT